MSMHARFAKKIEAYHETRTIVPVTDMHLHLVNFLQATAGMQQLLQSMHPGNIHQAVVFGLPARRPQGGWRWAGSARQGIGLFFQTKSSHGFTSAAGRRSGSRTESAT